MSIEVLIVEDESIVAMEIATYVRELGYRVAGLASRADMAINIAEHSHVDVVLMDVHIKGEMDGIDLAEILKVRYALGIIYITAFNDDVCIERAVETNPVAYLTKPFNRKELSAALKIATRIQTANTADIRSGDIKISDEFSFDREEQALLCCGEYVHLTHKERELLILLLEAKSRVVDFYTIENRLWPDKSPNENTRRSLIARLRGKLKHQFIETVPSQGYRLTY